MATSVKTTLQPIAKMLNVTVGARHIRACVALGSIQNSIPLTDREGQCAIQSLIQNGQHKRVVVCELTSADSVERRITRAIEQLTEATGLVVLCRSAYIQSMAILSLAILEKNETNPVLH